MLCAAAGGPAEYPHGQLLLDPAATKPADVADLVLLDARPQRDFSETRARGARWVDVGEWSKALGDGKDADGWSRRIGGLGITGRTQVAVYDDGTAKDAARVWWILRYWGVERARLVNAGWKGWTRAQLPVESGPPAAVAAVEFSARPQAERLATKHSLLSALPAGTLQIIDARSEAEFCGTLPLSNKRAGAIPGAKNLDWIELLDKQTLQFKSAEQLRGLFAEAGIDLSRPAAAHCQSGGRSSVMAFALELMGAEQVSNYYASWGEWGNADDTPVVPGKPKSK
jgi:thiosulfate/3-mercaptopyruvate sulfurtransferase